jgi:hypothetical protein
VCASDASCTGFEVAQSLSQAATVAEPTWPESVAFLASLDAVPAAQASARLLDQARPAWERRVVPRTSMHDLLFTRPGDQYPFPCFVRVSWSDGIFEFRFEHQGALITADRSYDSTAPAVLDAFLMQLAPDR